MVTSAKSDSGVLGGLIAWCAHNTGITLVMIAGLALWGWYSLDGIGLDAIPDLSDTQVIVLSEWDGQSPDLVEDQITYPLMSGLLAAPGVRSVRGQSFMGLSFVYVIFEDDTDLYWARSRVLEYITTVAAELPEAVNPVLGPDATGVGWVYQYAVVDRSGRHNLAELRSLQDFNLRYALESVPGVAEVASVGGYQQEYQVNIDPNLLVAHGLSVSRVANALQKSNADVGARVLEIAGHEYFVRGRGYVKSLDDIREVVIGMGNRGTPIRVADVAEVSLGPALQRGSADLNGEGLAVGGTVVVRSGENALAVIERVRQRLAELETTLPAGVEIVTTYDRADLIERAVDTLTTVLGEEMLVVSLVILLFLWHLRSVLVAVIMLPLAVLLAFIPMSIQGLSANIMSLGGIAVAIGAMVDAAIVVLDNVHRRLSRWQEATPEARRTRRAQLPIVISAMQEVGPSVFFSLLIITVSFLPVFALQGTEGKLFQPLAYTKSYAMFFAALLSVTLVPVLVVLLVRGRLTGHRNPVDRSLRAGYRPVLAVALHGRWLVLLLFLAAPVFAGYLYRQLQTEFMPPLNEGSLLYMPTAPPGMSITEAQSVLQVIDRTLMTFPEVETVFGKVGRSDTATDPAPLSMVEATITLKPRSQWREGLSWDGLVAEMDAALRLPGMPNVWWMPIQTRTEMMATGLRSALGVKLFGPDLEQLETTALQIEQALLADERTAPGTRSAFAERSGGGLFLDFVIDRTEAARYGLTVADIQQTLATAVGGQVVSRTVEGRERFDILLRYQREFRGDIDAIGRTLVATPGGAQIPLSQVARLDFATGPAMIRSEAGQLLGVVNVDVSPDIGIADYVQLAEEAVSDRVDIPAGVRLEWAGQYQNLERSQARLRLLVPLTLALILFMLYLHRRSLMECAIVFSTVPFAVSGSVFLLHWLGYRLSVAVAVGIIAVAGLAVELALLMVVYLDLARKQAIKTGQLRNRSDLRTVVLDAAALRIRPLLMTALTAVIGLLPIMLSTGTGADVMKRIAAPMLGGVGVALPTVLVLIPLLFYLWRGRGLGGSV